MKNKELAFPVPEGCQDLGLTKREMFAAMAMQGYVSRNNTEGWLQIAKEGDISIGSLIAKMSIECADALIAELGKEVEG